MKITNKSKSADVQEKTDKRDIEFWVSSVMTFIILGTGIFLKFYYVDAFENYSDYHQTIITAIGFILGMILVITIFYLGKAHDYKIEFIKNHGSLSEYMEKYRISLRSLESTQNDLNNWAGRILKLDSEFNFDSNKISDDPLKNLNQILTNMEESSKKIDEITNRVFKTMKKIPENFFISAWPFAVGFIFSSIIIDDPTLGDFYFLISFLITGLISFIFNWRLQEDTISLLHEMFTIITDTVSHFKAKQYDSEESNHDMEKTIEKMNELFLKITLDKENKSKS